MNHCGHACLVGNLNAVGEGEEGIRSHHGTLRAVAERAGFLDSLLEGVDARGLTHAAGKEHAVLGKNDGVALGVLDNLVGEEQVCGLCGCHGLDCNLLEVVHGLDLEVAVLNKCAVEARAELTLGVEGSLLHEDDAVFLLLEHLESLGGICGSDDYLEEYLVDFLGCSASTVPLVMSTPPNALTGSPARASFQASAMVGRVARPHALLCLSTAKVGSENSEMRLTAASMSRRLL